MDIRGHKGEKMTSRKAEKQPWKKRAHEILEAKGKPETGGSTRSEIVHIEDE